MSADLWTAVGAVAQCLTVGVAGWALWYARGQVNEARETRERVAQPDVVVYVDHHEIRRYMDLVVKNFGQTAAYNIRLTLPPLQVAPFKSQITGELVETLSIPESIAVLAPGREWRTVWDSAVRREKYKGELQTQFVGTVEFDDKLIPDKPSFCNPISLDINTFWNTTWIERTTNKTVEDALYDIAGTLKGYKQEHDGIWVYTVPGDEERQYYDQLRTDAEQRTGDFYEAATRRSDTPAQPQDEWHLTRLAVQAHNIVNVCVRGNRPRQTCGQRNVFIDVITVNVQSRLKVLCPSHFDTCIKWTPLDRWSVAKVCLRSSLWREESRLMRSA